MLTPTRTFAAKTGAALFTAILTAGLVSTADGAPPTRPPARHPNVVLFLLDDLGIHDLGAYGQPTTETPSIDRLAAEGMRFTEFRASSTVCSPTRLALLTGKLPSRSGARYAFHPQTRRGLDPADLTLAEVFKARGYVTGHLGKWHLGTLAGQLPRDHGFDEQALETRESNASSKYLDPAIVVWDGSSERTDCYGPENPRHPASCNRKPGRHLTDVLTDYAVDFVDRHRDRPFFLEVWHPAPHAPYQPVQEYLARYVEPPDLDAAAGFCDRRSRFAELGARHSSQDDWLRACYRALITQADAGVGRVVRRLEELGLADDTLVVVTSDNGLARTSQMENGGLRGSKLTLFEGGLRVPLIVRWPGRTAAGAVSSAPLFTHDLLPTLAEMVGVAAPSSDGRSFLGLLTGGASEDDGRLWVWQLENSLEPEGGEKAPYDYAIRDVVDGVEYKLIATPASGGPTRLFRIGSDPGERRDVAEDHPDVAEALERRYREWLQDQSTIPVTVARVDAGAGVGPDGSFDLRSGGTVTLAEDFRHRIDDRDFTLALHLRPLGDGAGASERPRTLAEQEGSWKMTLEPSGRLRLVVHGVEKSNGRWRSGDPACPSCIVLEGTGEIAGGAGHDLAFTVKGHSFGPSRVRLYFDGRLQAESRRLPKIAPGEGPIVFGGSAADALRGMISDLRILGATLEEQEL
jgi:arylsulfatase